MKKRSGEKIKLLSVDELLGVPSGDPVTEIDVEKIYPFENPERLPFRFSLSCIGEGNGNPLQVLAWRIPGTGEPGGLLSMGSHRVGHD